METKTIYVDANNKYIQGLVKVLNDFLVEEVCNCNFSELHLTNKIKALNTLYGNDKRKLSENSSVPKFASHLDDYRIVFKDCNHTPKI